MASLFLVGRRCRAEIRIATFTAVSLVLFAETAFGLGLTLTQVGGTAVNGQGVIGDTITVAVDFTIEADELMIGAFPTLWWDQEGGNVIDIVSSAENGSATLGGMTFNPINLSSLLFDSADTRNANVRSFPDGSDFADTQTGTTYMVGFETTYFFNGNEAELANVIASGAPGPAVINMGQVTFRLSGLGTTTIGLFVDPTGVSSISSLVVGPRGITYTGDEVSFTDLPVSSIGFGALQIVVVPEPSTALLLMLGLGFAASRRQSIPLERRSLAP